MSQRRTLLAGALALASLPPAARAQTFPPRPVRWIVPYVTGGGSDITARIVADGMRQSLGQPLVIENRPGGGTIIGMQALLSSLPDGLTVATADSGTLAFNPSLYEKLPYLIETSFSYIGGIGRMPLVLVSRPGFPANSVKELLAVVAKQPGRFTYASAGLGSPHHLAMELFQQQTGIRTLHVPYKGGSPAVQDLLSGQVDLMMLDLPGGLTHMRGGKLGLFGTALSYRAPQLPDVPTLHEEGVVDFVAFAWQGMVAPAATQRSIVQRLDAELRKALALPEVESKLGELGVDPMEMSSEQFAAYVFSEHQRWAKVIDAARIKLNG